MKKTILPDLPIPVSDWTSLAGLCTELQDLKRQQPAHYDRSISSELFVESWERLYAGKTVQHTALIITAKALLHILLPGCDAAFFTTAGLTAEDVHIILCRALTNIAQERIHSDLFRELMEVLPEISAEYASGHRPTYTHLFDENEFRPEAWFVQVLCRQPRAGATAPGKPRLLLSPPEMHSDHCLMTAVYAVLFAGKYHSDAGQPWLAGLAHHLHNAVLPDCGFAGEILLNDRLDDIFSNSRERALASMPSALSDTVRSALRYHETIDTPQGKSISTGDVIDRVLDVKWRTRAAAVQDQDILGELELVHAGPLKDFQDDLLARTELWIPQN